LQVPYLLEFQPKCNGGFDDFPSRCGIKVEELQQGKLDACTIDSVIPFLQEWLFFGLLQEIFEHASVTFRREDFIRTSDSSKLVVSTEHLPRYIWYWAASIAWARDMNPGSKSWKEQQGGAARVLELANACINGVIQSQCVSGVASSHADNVLLSISVLGETLDAARDTVFFTGREEFYGVLTWELPDFGKRLLLEAGWCTGEIKALCRDFTDVSSLYYFSTWDRSTLGKNHDSCGQRCFANQVNENTYKTRHTDPKCQCTHLPTEKLQSIFDILGEGGIPVVWFFEDGKIHVGNSACDTPAIPGWPAVIPYVAISHVWSDGLGNAKANTLPWCQLQRIQGLVNALYQVPFWMDTLCVPLEPAFRKMAIRRMSETYLNANKVLVLDASLQTISVHESIQECMMRITTSPWATRLWTFQEGVLAFQLHFQFCDGTITPRLMEIRSQTEGRGHTALANFLCDDSMSTSSVDCTAFRLVRALASGLQTPLNSDQPVHPLPGGPERQEQWKSLASQCVDFPNYHDIALFRKLSSNFSSIVYTSSVKALLKAIGGTHLRDLLRPPDPGRLRWADCPGSTLYDFLPVLGTRTSSKPEDETLCLGGVLGLDITPLLDCRGAERMKTFLSLVDTVPPDLIFAPGLKMSEAGYRWAPTSFMNTILEPLPQLLRAVDPPKPGRLHPRGLLVILPGLKMKKATFPERSMLYTVGTGFDDHVRVKLELVNGGRWSDYSGLDGLVVLRSNYTERAALVFLREKLEGTLFVEFEALVSAKEGGDFKPDVKVKVMDDDVRWCVG
jgi:hypothetical protein